MRILLLTQVVPFPPDSGPKIKTYHLLRYLAQRHEVHLLSFARSQVERNAAAALLGVCATVETIPLSRSRLRDVIHLATSVTTRRPFLIQRDDCSAMRGAVSRQLANRAFDAIHADQLSMGQFAVDAEVPLRVLDEHNAVWTIVQRAATRLVPGPQRMLAELEWRKLRAYEGDLVRAFDAVTVVSEADQQALTVAAGAPFTAVRVPIALDTHEFAFSPRTSAARDIVSVATMFYPPNVEGVEWFSRDVFPRIRQGFPDVGFSIVGSRPPKHITRLAKPGSGIRVLGYVPDLEPVLCQSAVLIVPIRSGSGMRVKILEAFARGIPVVSTQVGIEGIDARSGTHLLVADSAAQFAEAVSSLLSNPAEARRLAKAARALVEARYDWQTALVGLDAIYPTGRGAPPIHASETVGQLGDALARPLAV
jgi:polysaccharide biosynthesis protein PslH